MLVARVALLAGEEGLAVLVESEVGDLHVGGVDGDLSLLAVRLLFDEFLNVDAPSAAVNFSNFAFAVLVGATDNLDSVTIANGNGAGHVLAGELLAQLRGHHSPAEGGGGSEVSLSGLSALAGHVC